MMLSIMVFSAAYMLKGGWLGKIKGWDEWTGSIGSASVFFGGKFLSGLLVFLYTLAFSPELQIEFIPFIAATIVLLAWVIAVPPSIGEEVGAIGRYGYWWGDYKDAVYPAGHQKAGLPVFDRSYGLAKAAQRGVWMGAVFTLIGMSPVSILVMGVGFIAAHFVMQEIHYRVKSFDSCAWAEPVVGGLIGFCYGG